MGHGLQRHTADVALQYGVAIMSELQRAFERWFTGTYDNTIMDTDTKGAYISATTQLAWAAFKGGRAYIPRAKVA